jgi:aspartate aminotransferase-like enzyme
MPTDGLRTLRASMADTLAYGLERSRSDLVALGGRVRALLESHGFASVAAEGFQAPCVVVSYTDDDEIKTGRAFAALGLQTAAGVPLQCDEPADFRTFRIGLFGLDKIGDVDRTVAALAQALEQLHPKPTP